MSMFKRYLLSTTLLRAPEGEGGAAAPEGADAQPAAGEAAAPAEAAKPGEGEGEAAAAAEDADKEPPQRQRSASEVFQGRIGKLTREKREAEERAARAEAELRAARDLLQARPADKPAEGEAAPPAAKPPIVPPDLDQILDTPEGKRRVNARAAAAAEAAEISRRGDELYDVAEKEFGKAKLDKALENFKAFDGLRVDVAQAILNVPDGHKVLYAIGSNPAEIERIYSIAERSSVALGVEIAKLSTKFAAEPGPRKVSQAPEPPENQPGRGNGGPVDLADRELPMAKWVEEREKDLKRRGVRL